MISPSRVGIVTDSTCSLGAAETGAAGVSVVPLRVVIDGRALVDDGEATPGQVAEALGRWVPVTTSQPTPEAFTAAYAAAAAAGADAVVSVHLSAEVSGTCSAARLGAARSPVPVEVIDSTTVGLGLGLAVRAAVAARDAGGTPALIADAARRSAAATDVHFYVDTLEHLRRGGRIGSAQALVGSVLSVKPILRLDAGKIVPVAKVRTAARALARLEEIALAGLPVSGSGVDAAVQHLAAPGAAHDLAGRLKTRLPGLGPVEVTEIGAVVGAHVGPGMLAVVIRRPR